MLVFVFIYIKRLGGIDLDFLNAMKDIITNLGTFLGTAVGNVADLCDTFMNYITSDNSLGAVVVSSLAVIGIYKLISSFIG